MLIHLNLLIALLLTTFTLSQATCGVIFYWDSGYGGGSFTLYDGQARQDLTQYNWNDQISGLRFLSSSDGRKCVARVCWNTYCQWSDYGGGQDYIDDTPYVGDYANDQFSAVQVFSYNPVNDSYAMLYKSCRGAVDYSWFVVPSEIANKQDIFLSDLSKGHIGNDALSRVVLSGYAAVILYQDDFYLSDQLLLTGYGDYNCLDAQGWNDRASSIKFYDLTAGNGFPSPLGYWTEQMSAGYQQTLSRQVAFGYTTTDSTSTQTTFSQQITNSIEAGIEFEGVGSEKTSVSVTVSSSIAQDVSSSIQKSTTVTCGLTCMGGTCPSGIMVMYTWTMGFARPWEQLVTTTLDSCNYLCTCGNQPRCPLGACVDASCTTCYPYS